MRSWLELVYPESPDPRAAFAAHCDSLQAQIGKALNPTPRWKRSRAGADLRRVICERTGLSVADIAKRLGITPPYLYDIIRGYRKGKQVRLRLVNELGVPAELLGLEAQ